MYVCTRLLDYNALAICTHNPTNRCDNSPTGVVTMAMKVLHNTCNMCIPDLPDMEAICMALGIHIRQFLHAHVTTITYTLPGTLQKFKWEDCMTVQKGSWGYKRNTDINGYHTAEELINQLVIAVRYCIQYIYVC